MADELDATDDDDDASEGFEAYDELLAARGLDNPWKSPDGEDGRRIYLPDLDLLRDMLAIPVGTGHARKQTSGRVAKAFDAWIAHELRRAGFPEGAVWPRARQPRVLPAELAEFEKQLDKTISLLTTYEATLKASGEGTYLKPTPFRHAVKKLSRMLPGTGAAKILGRFYVKQVDVVVSSWQRGPDVLVSTKTAFSSYLNNIPNRYEEAVGEASNLRDRHPMSAMGFAFLVRTNIYEERGAYAYLRDLLVRLRKPDGPFDATMLLAATWDEDEIVTDVEGGSEELTPARFFDDLVRAVTTNTPVTVHTDVRLRRDGEPAGGLPTAEDEDD
jgi:hypothetical protein